MSDKTPQSEPTMEEILASIRRIISEDEPKPGEAVADGKPAAAGSEPAAAAAAATAAPGDAAEADDDELDLTEAMQASPPPQAPPPQTPSPQAPSPQAPAEALVQFASAASAAPRPEPRLPPEPMAEPIAVIAAAGTRIVSERPAGDSTASFAQLASAVSQSRGVQLGLPSRTLEDLVKELLRPMLREWLDGNLPKLVERLIEKEIAKISGKADDN